MKVRQECVDHSEAEAGSDEEARLEFSSGHNFRPPLFGGAYGAIFKGANDCRANRDDSAPGGFCGVDSLGGLSRNLVRLCMNWMVFKSIGVNRLKRTQSNL